MMGQIFEKGTELNIKLVEAEKQKFEELYDEILADDGIPNIMGRIDEIMIQVKESQEPERGETTSLETEDEPNLRSNRSNSISRSSSVRKLELMSERTGGDELGAREKGIMSLKLKMQETSRDYGSPLVKGAG